MMKSDIKEAMYISHSGTVFHIGYGRVYLKLTDKVFYSTVFSREHRDG
jgi:hypothetical protein